MNPRTVAVMLGFCAACARPASQETTSACTGPGCSAVCETGAFECRGDRAAQCQEGRWTERTCEIACRQGRCVECAEDDRRCAGASTVEVCEDGQFVSAACGPGGCSEGHCQCPDDPYQCADGVRQHCDGDGVWTADPCPSDAPTCYEGACLLCVPGSAVCKENEDTSEVCSDNGRSRGPVACLQGCDPASGRCFESCSPGQLRCRSARAIERCSDDGSQYGLFADCDVSAGERCFQGACRDTCEDAESMMSPSGCVFRGVPMDFPAQGVQVNTVGTDRPLTVFHIVNPDRELEAQGEASQGSGPPTQFYIPPGGSFQVETRGRSVSVFNSHRVRDSAVTLRTNRPVYVVQHMDVNDTALSVPNNEESQSGDTAFLLPAHLLDGYGTRYRILTQPFCTVAGHPNHARPGGFTILSITNVAITLQITFTAPTLPGPSGFDPQAYSVGGPVDIPLDVGETLHFRAANGDLTGTLVESTAPVAVFNGGVSRIPCAAGHVQTQLVEEIMPVGLWGEAGQAQTHLAAARELAPGVGEEQWVALTDEPDNDLRLEPVPGGGSATPQLASAGDFYTFYTASDAAGEHVAREFTLDSAKPILLGRYYYVKNTYGGSTFTFERPLKFWRSQYSVRSVGASRNRLLLLVPEGRDVFLNSARVVAPRRVGRPGYEIMEMEVGTRVHHLSADASFGLLVYGFAPGDVRDCYSYAGPVGFQDVF